MSCPPLSATTSVALLNARRSCVKQMRAALYKARAKMLQHVTLSRAILSYAITSFTLASTSGLSAHASKRPFRTSGRPFRPSVELDFWAALPLSRTNPPSLAPAHVLADSSALSDRLCLFLVTSGRPRWTVPSLKMSAHCALKDTMALSETAAPCAPSAWPAPSKMS